MKQLRFFSILAALLCSVSMMAQNKGYEKALELFGGPGLSDDSKYSLGVDFVNGYRANETFFIGGGVGFKYAECRYYHSYMGKDDTYDSRDNKYLIPVFARAKVNLTKTNVSPFIAADLGWTFDVGQNPNKNIEGFFAEPQLGLDFNLGGLGMYLNAGVNIQNFHYTYFTITDRETGDENISYMIGTLNIKFGVRF